MKLCYFKGQHPNFGDDLNAWMWPKLLPDFFDEEEDIVLIGIGSIIGEREFSSTQRKIIFGSGFVPEYHSKPDVSSDDWEIAFVRGPRTARLLGIDPALALGDSALPLRTMVDYKAVKREVVSFMPHWLSLDRGNWEEVCRKAGVNLIDPRRSVDEVIAELLRSRLVITEAMHGAIVADAFRIPWVAMLPLNPVHRGKWYDWAEALGIKLKFHRLFPSSLGEARLSFLRGLITRLPGQGLIGRGMSALAALRLRSLARQTGQMSNDEVIDRVTSEMQRKIEQLLKDYGTVGSPQREARRAENRQRAAA